MSYKTLILLFASTQTILAAIHNGSSIARTFVIKSRPVPDVKLVTDEPLDLVALGLDDQKVPQSQLLDHSNRSKQRLVARPNNPSVPDKVKRTNSSVGYHYVNEVSDEVIHFLTSPLSTIFIPSLYTLVCLVSVPLNAIAVVIFARRIRPMKPAVIYMLNLACADLLFALLLPFKIVYHFNHNDWLFGPSMCSVVTAAFYCNMYCSVLLIACIAVDRLLAVVYPMDSLSWRSPRNAALACSAAWLLALGGSVPLVLNEQTVRFTELDITTCHDLQDPAQLRGLYLVYFPTLSCLLFFLPLLVTVVCYGRVIWTLSAVPLGVVGRSRRRARAVAMAMNVLVLFVVCFTPTNCLLLVHYLQYSQDSEPSGADATYAAYLVCLCVGSVSCCLDPLVYYFGSSQCQRQLAGVLGCGKGSKGSKSLQLSSGSSRTSTRYILKSSVGKNSPLQKTDAFQASLNSQYKKLLV